MAQHRVNRGGGRPGAGPGAEDQESGGGWLAVIDPRKAGWLMALLLAVPVAIGLSLFDGPPTARFIVSGLAIIPLAGLMGRSTEALAHRLGPGIGGLLNATFGNAAELILAMLALRRGLDDVVKASLTGSVIGNLLLVMGASLLAGGMRYPTQRFNRTAAGAASLLMALAAIGMLVPALFHAIVGPGAAGLEHKLSVSVCLVLIAAYGLNLLFSLKTHKDIYGNPTEGSESGHGHDEPGWTTRKSAIVLIAATSLVAWMSEILVGAVEPAGHALGLSGVFMGVIVVAIVGNAAEHSSAILVAMKNQMDLSVGIALGSALQVALFVAPVLVFASYLRDEPMDLLFTTFEVVAVILSVVVARMVADDGESNWLEGAMLLMLYAILGVAFFFLPEPKPGAAGASRPAAVSASAHP